MRPAKRTFKITAIAILSVAAAGFIGTAVLYRIFPGERVRSMAAERAEKALKRKVRIGGIEYGLRGIHFTDVIVYDGPTEKDGVLARANRGRVSISLNALLRLRFDLNYITLEGFKLNIFWKDGVSNVGRLIHDMATDEAPAPRTKIKYISLAEAELGLVNPPGVLKPLAGTYGIRGTADITDLKNISITDLNIRLPEKRGLLKSDSVRIERGEGGGFALRANVKLESCSLLWVYGWKDGAPLPFRSFDGAVKDLAVTQQEVTGHARGTGQLPGGRALSVDGFCKVTIPTRHTLVYDTSGEMGKSKVSLKALSIQQSGEIDRMALSKLSVDFSDIRGLLPFLPEGLYGTATGEFSLEKGVVNAELAISGASLGHEKKILSGIDGIFRIVNNSFQKENIDIRVLDTPFRVSVATTGRSFSSFTVNAEASEMVIDPDKSAASGLDFSNITIPVTVTGRAAIQKLDIGSYGFTQAFAAFTTSRKQVNLNRVAARFMGGSLEGRGTIDFSRNAMDIETSFSFEKVRIQNIAELSEKFKNRAFGTAKGRAELGLRASKGEEALKSMKGRLEFTVSDGKLVDTGIQNGLGAVLSDMRYKLKDLEFSSIYGNFNIAGGNYYVNLFQFEAPDIRLKLDGYFNRDLDGDMKVQLEFNKNFIQDLPNPALLRLNAYKQGPWYSIPFKIQGNITRSENITRLK